ncbi:MAG: BTAD domain-containing putative transcriptional regulator, partial [Acidimicrobiales bacterium]
MRIGLLGPLEVVDDGHAVAIGGTQERDLLALLALHAGRAVPEPVLIEALWPDHPATTAVAILRECVEGLRGVVRIEARSEGFVLVAGPEDLDTLRLAGLVDAARTAAARFDHLQALRLFDEALGLWRGRSLEDVAHRRFAAAEAARLDHLRQELAEERLDLDRRASGPGADPAPVAMMTFLFTDIEGSTERWEQWPLAMRRALERHDALIAAAVAAEGGAVFKSVGDALHACFTSPAAGLRAAWAAQRALLAEDWGLPAGLAVRMAVYTGEAEALGADWLGRPLNRCGRLLAAGSGAQVLVSRATADLVHDHLPEGVTLVDLGQHRLRGLARPEQVFQLAGPGLRTGFAPLATLEPESDEPALGLPPALGAEAGGAFVGRRDETDRLASAWERARQAHRQV